MTLSNFSTSSNLPLSVGVGVVSVQLKVAPTLYKSFLIGRTNKVDFNKKLIFNSGALMVMVSPLVPFKGKSLKYGLDFIPYPSQKTIFFALISLYKTPF